MSTNPLSKYYRQPGVQLRLPSLGKWWPANALTMPPNQEIPVLPMTGKDDISMRNADGLMNGSTTVEVIESCCPNIKDGWAIPSIDIDAILIAIRLASYGPKMDFETKCKNCNEHLDYEVDLTQILDTIQIPDFETPLTINDLMIWFKPNLYKDMNEVSQQKYTQQRMIQSIQNSSLTDDEKIAKFKQTVSELTEQAVKKLATFIDYVITDDGQRVNDAAFIEEFIMNADQETYNAIKNQVAKLNQDYKLQPLHITCDSCGHEDFRDFQFEPANFFG